MPVHVLPRAGTGQGCGIAGFALAHYEAASFILAHYEAASFMLAHYEAARFIYPAPSPVATACRCTCANQTDARVDAYET